MEADARAFGLPAEAFAEVEEEEDGLWEEHLPAFTAFLEAARQWRVLTAQRLLWLGLDYTAVQAGLALSGLTVSPETWADIRTIETGALPVLNET